MIISKKDFYEALLKEQLGLENYETCAIIKELLERIDPDDVYEYDLEREDDDKK